MKGLRRFLIFILGVSMPFNHLTFLPNYSFGLLASSFYLLAMSPYMPSLGKLGRRYGGFVWALLMFVLLRTCINLMNYSGLNTPIFPFSNLMCIILMLFLLIHGLIDRKALSICLYGIAFGGVAMAVLFTMGIGVTIADDYRISMFGENANALGIYMVLSSIVILNDFTLNDGLHMKKWRYLWIIVVVPLVGLLFATGSRVTFISFTLSFVAIVLLHPVGSKSGKLFLLIAGVLVSVYTFNRLVDTESVIMKRLTRTIETGDTAGRDEITEKLLPYVAYSPLLGYGDTGYAEIARASIGLSQRSDKVLGESPHNVIVELLLLTGIIGLLLWLVFWYNIGKEAWILFKKKRLLPPGTLCIPILGLILSGQILEAKWAYIIYAYVMVEYFYYRNPKNPSYDLPIRDITE